MVNSQCDYSFRHKLMHCALLSFDCNISFHNIHVLIMVPEPWLIYELMSVVRSCKHCNWISLDAWLIDGRCYCSFIKLGLIYRRCSLRSWRLSSSKDGQHSCPRSG